MFKNIEEIKYFLGVDGEIGRAGFIVYSFVFTLLLGLSLMFFCPATIRVFQVPDLVVGKSVIEVVSMYSPGNEEEKFLTITSVYLIVMFFLLKKRFFDMFNKDTWRILFASYLCSLSCICLFIRFVLLLPDRIAGTGLLIVWLFLSFRKYGKVV